MSGLTTGYVKPLPSPVSSALRNPRRTKIINLLPALALICGALAASPSVAGIPGEFEETGSMITGRGGHGATLLPNGNVLVAGGSGGTAAELYDPGSGNWSATGSLAQARYSHAPTLLLPNGNVLLGSGFVSGIICPSTVGSEIYDPSTETWGDRGYVGAPEGSATLLPNGKVLTAGGHGYSAYCLGVEISWASLYDPASGTTTFGGNMLHPHFDHTATLLSDGKVLVAGGRGIDSSKSAELYDPATGTWSATGDLDEPRFGHRATLLGSGKVLITGGYAPGYVLLRTAELYDPATGTWTRIGDLAAARAGHTATLLASHRVLVTGGRNDDGALATAELYDPATGVWSPTGNMNRARSGHSATLLPNKQVLIAGGGSDGRTAELYTEAPTAPSLLNISTRVRIETSDNAMIGGFIITGTQTKTVIVRGIGPSLGMPGTLQDPIIEVHGSSGELLATNDNWRDAATRQEIIDSGFAPAHDAESALWGVVNPGAYTVVVRGKNDTTGIGLFEVYDLDQTADASLGNVSTRGLAQNGDDVMIGGVIVGGGTEGASSKVLLRAIGPSIPLNGVLADPTLELRNASGTLVVSNDNWKMRPDGTSQQAEIEATSMPPSNDLESAAVQTLGPGQYTAIVRGKNNATGVGLVEVFNLR